jgi:ZIP family zinc transporter
LALQGVAIAVSAGTFLTTLLGGVFALRLKDRLHLMVGFSAGAVLAVAFFDLLPEALALAAPRRDASLVLGVAMVGFIAYMVLDRAFAAPRSVGPRDRISNHPMVLGAASLSVHSFIDGVIIGLAFRTSSSIAMVVSTAVLVHDFSDGVNTVGVVLTKAGSLRGAWRWLLIDALAPVLGAACTLWLTVSSDTLALLLALCAGFFLYLAGSDLLPESYHQHPTTFTTAATIVGMAVLYVVSRMAG